METRINKIYICNYCEEINPYEEKGFCSNCWIGTYEENILNKNTKEGLKEE